MTNLDPQIIMAGAAVIALMLSTLAIVQNALDKKAERRAIDARTAGFAFALRRQLRKWLSMWNSWNNWHRQASHIQSGFADAERRVESMLFHAPEGTAEVARAAQHAAEAFWEGADYINDVLGWAPTSQFDTLMDRAKRAFEESAAELDFIIDPPRLLGIRLPRWLGRFQGWRPWSGFSKSLNPPAGSADTGSDRSPRTSAGGTGR